MVLSKDYNIQDAGRYLEAEAEGSGFSRDVMEFLVNTAFGDSKGQFEKMKKLVYELGWYVPSFESMD
ncbi:hypothetical protein AALP_AA5G022900 [Arabis alpina]|uniref:Uncharacterized protein n=1 Tax=Arabis alpina TaxID=50452 RepID=A0A087GUG3_ARAAL|nr:hypothetical protein AALP_AA5G022900 [Arabis alpina]